MAITFIGRKKELSELNDLLEKKVASMVVIRGRRRIGKSRLIREFARGKNFLEFSGMAPTKETTAQSQRDAFINQLAKQTSIPEITVDDWDKAFALLAREIGKKQIVILFDEISWMGSEDSDFLGKLKNAWEWYFSNNPKLILILCGSVSVWIEKNILSATAFFGRICLKIHLEELSLEESNQLLTAVGFKRSSQERLILLSVVGGIPWYIELIHPKYSAMQNINRLCFAKNGTLVEEFDLIFNDLFGKRGNICKEIVNFLAKGPANHSDIANHLNYSRNSVLSEYLNDLEMSGFICKDYSWSLKSGNEISLSRFRLKDNYLRFYLKYILPRRNKINLGQYSEIEFTNFPNWEGIMGLQFENLILANKKMINEILGIKATEIVAANQYYQKSTKTSKGCQIDYLVQTKFNNIFVCEIKFTKKLNVTSIIKEIENKIKTLKLPRGFAVQPVLIHASSIEIDDSEQEYFYKIIDLTKFIS